MMGKTSLEDLPASNDKEFWGEAEVHTNITPQNLLKEGMVHYFIRVSGHEATCTHCSWGFCLDPGDKIKDGHLFSKDGNLVI